MSDETTSNPAPVDTVIPQAPEAPISTAPEAVIAPAPVEAPVEPAPVLESLDSSPLGASGEAPGRPGYEFANSDAN